MKDFAPALSAGRKLIERYPNAAAPVRRSAWLVVAHSSLELADYPNAEQAYGQVLALTPAEDESRAGLVENLAASIYKQGEQANEQANYRAAADHFLRIKQVAPTAKIRAAAEYDAGAALIRLEDWATAATVLDAFRTTYPAARAAARSDQADRAGLSQGRSAVAFRRRVRARRRRSRTIRELRAEALLLAGQLHEEATSPDRALAVYQRYVEQFPKPVEAAVETHFKIAGIYQRKNDTTQLSPLAGTDRPDRCGGGRRAHGAHALPGRQLGAGAGTAGLRELRLAASSCSRSSRASKRSSVA